jgi:IS5 family transposase
MLRDRYAPMNLFAVVPALSYTIDRVLAQLDRLLDEDTLFQAVKADLAQRFPRTMIDGRPSTPVEVILRMLVIKHLYGWSYAQTEHWVSDSLVLRQFCRVYLERVPDHTTLLRWANLIQPATLHQLLDHVVDLARQLKVTRGRKLRIDGTVVETNIHHPSDSTLLHDGVRVLSRTLRKAKQVLSNAPQAARKLFRDRTRSAKRHMKRIMEVARQRGADAEQRLQTTYQQLIEVAEAMVAQAQQVDAALHGQTRAAAQRLAETLDHYVPLVEQVIAQTTRRVLQDEQVPASEKVVSLFEPHTAIIRKGKPGKPTEFGRVIWLDEVDGGIISRYEVLDGNPDETAQLPPSLDHHLQRFKGPPRLLTGDRGIHSSSNERYATEHGVKYVVLPKPGRVSKERKAHEQQRWFRRGFRFRAGIEGRIRVLKRDFGLGRCRDHGADGMGRWVGWGIVTANLTKIAETQAARQPAKGRRPAA